MEYLYTFFMNHFKVFLYRIIFKFMNRSNLTEIILYIVMPIITIITCIITGIILKRYLQRIYYVLT